MPTGMGKPKAIGVRVTAAFAALAGSLPVTRATSDVISDTATTDAIRLDRENPRFSGAAVAAAVEDVIFLLLSTTRMMPPMTYALSSLVTLHQSLSGSATQVMVMLRN